MFGDWLIGGNPVYNNTYHGSSFVSAVEGYIELTVQNLFTHSLSVLDDICQQAFVLNSHRKRLIMLRVEWLIFFANFFFFFFNLGGGDHLHKSPGYQYLYHNTGCSHWQLYQDGHAWSQVYAPAVLSSHEHSWCLFMNIIIHCVKFVVLSPLIVEPRTNPFKIWPAKNIDVSRMLILCLLSVALRELIVPYKLTLL